MRVVTSAAVWAALEEIPDPEIPVISLVDLGVIRDVQIDGDRVRSNSRQRFSAAPRSNRCSVRWRRRWPSSEPSRRSAVIQDDSWSTDQITPAGREKLRDAGFAPPAMRSAGPTTLLQLQSKAFRCPYCGSTDTRLENIFGPTPCRSIRWCESCRQPFEQFKTI